MTTLQEHAATAVGTVAPPLAPLPNADAAAEASSLAEPMAQDPPPPTLPPWRRALTRPLDTLLARQITAPMTLGQRANLRFFWKDGVWAAISDSFALNFIPLFAVAFGAAPTQIGILASVGSLAAAAAFLPGARLVERLGRRKPIVVWSVSLLYRGSLLAMALVPLITSNATVAIWLLTLFAAVRAFGLNLADPAWTSMSADLVPARMRGRYFSLRNFLMGIAALVITPLAGWLVGRSPAVTGSPLPGYQLTLVLSFAAGMVATATFRRINEPPMQRAEGGVAVVRPSALEILRGSRALTAFIVSAFIWNMALQVASPYFNVYLVTQLGGTAATVGVVSAISALAGLAGQIVFGRLTERKGSVWVFLVSGFCITILPVFWAFYTAPWQVGINNLFGGFLWAGFLLATFNLLLLLTPDAHRARATALYQTVVFTSAVIGPLIGGYLAENVSFPLIFIVSGIGRLTAMLVFAALGARYAFAQERRTLHLAYSRG